MGPFRTPVRIILPVPFIFLCPFLQLVPRISWAWHSEKAKLVCMTLSSRELLGLPSLERVHRATPSRDARRRRLLSTCTQIRVGGSQRARQPNRPLSQ